MYDDYKNIEEYNPDKKHKILTGFGNLIADMYNSKKYSPIVTDFFVRGRKLNISFAFIVSSYFAEPNNITLNSTYHFIMKIPNKQKLQQIAFNHQILTFKTMNLYGNVLENHILF